MKFKIDFGNKSVINEKDYKDNKNNIHIYDLENTYNLLTKKNKEEFIKEYMNVCDNIGYLFFKKEGSNKPDPTEAVKNKIDITKNRQLENENTNLDIKDNMSFESLFQIILGIETTNFINYYDNDYDYYSNEEEEPPLIKAIINEIQSLEDILNRDIKSEKPLAKKKIQLYLFLIYMILKNYPLFIPKRSYLEKYYLQLKKYKDWPDQIGSLGKNLYKLFINELYLPGVTIFKELRDNYFLDLIDPNKFLFISDDFLRYYFYLGNECHSSSYKFLKEDMPDENFNTQAKEIFSPATNIFNMKNYNRKADVKSIKEFNYLSIMHLIIFFCQQILSHEEKVNLSLYQRLCEQYCKTMPDYKNKEVYNELIGKKNPEQKKKNNNSDINEKNAAKNTTNKSLFNSFLNILDVGLKTDYYKEFLPMIKEIEKKIINSIIGQEGSNDNNYLNLRKFLIPKIEIRNQKDISLINLYQCNYINIEDKYLSHLSKTMDYKDCEIKPERKLRVDQFNCFVNIKKNILESYIKLRFILYEEQLAKFIENLVNEVEELQINLIEREEREKELLLKQKQKEKEQKEKILKLETEKKSKKKKDEARLEEERKKKEYEENLKTKTYYELILENNNNNSDVKELMKKRESNALPEVENFLNSITLYILPNDNSDILDQNLSDYICRNDFIYQYLFYKRNMNDYSAMNKILKENLCIYLEEAKNSFELDVYKVILTEDMNNPNELNINYFYSYIALEIQNKTEVSIFYLNNKESPESEIKKENISGIGKIYIMNIMFKEKGKNDTLPGAKYILNENSGLLTVFCMKGTQNEPNNTNNLNNINYYGKLLAHQTKADIFNCDEIKITGKFKIEGIPEYKDKNSYFEEIIVGHATYDLGNQEKKMKLKIATFNEFNINK